MSYLYYIIPIKKICQIKRKNKLLIPLRKQEKPHLFVAKNRKS